MLGIVIAAHGNLSEGFKSAAQVIFGVTDNMECVNLNLGDDIEALGAKINTAVDKVDQGDGIIVLTDLLNASPYNQSLLMTNQMEERRKDSVYVLSGINMPMVLETINHQIIGTPFHEIADQISYQGKEGVNVWHHSPMDFINYRQEDSHLYR